MFSRWAKNTCNKKFALESCPKISFLPGILTKNIFRKIKNFSENFFDLKFINKYFEKFFF